MLIANEPVDIYWHTGVRVLLRSSFFATGAKSHYTKVTRLVGIFGWADRIIAPG